MAEMEVTCIFTALLGLGLGHYVPYIARFLTTDAISVCVHRWIGFIIPLSTYVNELVSVIASSALYLDWQWRNRDELNFTSPRGGITFSS